MSVRTTVTLDDDVLARVRDESRSRGQSFRSTLNELLREALAGSGRPERRRSLQIRPSHMGPRPELNYDDVEGLLEYAEGEAHR
jgi:hypothetical protein